MIPENKAVTMDRTVLKSLNRLYKGDKVALVIATKGWLVLRATALKSIKGKFTENEFKALIDIQNGMLLTPEYQMNHQLFYMHFKEADNLNGTCEKWEISLETMREKIMSLDQLEVFFIQEEIARFWNELDVNGEKFNLGKFVEEYASKEVVEE